MMHMSYRKHMTELVFISLYQIDEGSLTSVDPDSLGQTKRLAVSPQNMCLTKRQAILHNTC